jgi:hypothetical protein
MRVPLLTAIGLLAVVPAPQARAATAQPLADIAPTAALGSRDRVFASTPQAFRARAAASSSGAHAYATADGQSISVTTSSAYTGDETAVAQSYVDFLGSLPHGSELGKLKVHIAPAAEVQASCGGQAGTLACYFDDTHTMIVPGEETDNGDGITTSYVIAHEYGHHVASFRSNAPFSAPDYGPKYWSSDQRVCEGVLQSRLVVGAQTTDAYYANPGEGWAETYARLKYPAQPWTFTSRLKPDTAAYAAARRDVTDPWTKSVVKTFHGRFAAGGAGASSRHFTMTLHLDGALSFRLSGPAAANYDLAVSARDKSEGTTKAAGSQDTLTFAAACREQTAEVVSVTVKRRSGSGSFTLQAHYAG